MINILLFNSSSVTLNDGFTLNDYIIRVNADKVSYYDICQILKLKLREARAIYDKVWNVPLEDIGTPRKTLALVNPTNTELSRLVLIKNGADWRKCE